MTFARFSLGENIIEVRPKVGAHIWSNRTAGNPQRGPGELVIPLIKPAFSPLQYTGSSEACFLFMGGKGCARVGPAGERLGGNQ